MSLARAGAATAVILTAALGLSGCGSMGDHKIGETAKVTVTNTGDYDVTVTAIDPAPAEVAARYDTEDQIYFVTFTTKLAKPGEADPTGVSNYLQAKLEDGTVVSTSFDHIDECEHPSGTELEEKLAANETVEGCVPVAGDDGKKVVAIRIGATDLDRPGAQVWTIG